MKVEPEKDVEKAAAKSQATEEVNVPPDGETEEEIVPPDGGWGWFCVVGCALMHTFLIGTERSFGFIYLELIDMFHQSAALTAWVGSLTTALRLGLGPLASLLASRFTCRVVTMVGGFIFFAGVVLSAFPPNLFYLFFSWGVLIGVGGAMVYTPSFIIVGKYFDKRRAIANGISTAGGGVGQFAFPPLYTALLGHYGFMGSLLVIGAITFNLINCGALYRPLKPRRVSKNRGGKVEPGMSTRTDQHYESIEMKERQMDKNDSQNGDSIGSIRKEENIDGARDGDSIGSIRNEGNIAGAYDGDSIGSIRNEGNIAGAYDGDSIGSIRKKGNIAGAYEYDGVDIEVIGNAAKQGETGDDRQMVAGPSRDFGHISGTRAKTEKTGGKFYFDCSLFCDPVFVLFACFIGFGTQAYVPTSTFVPALAVYDRGLTKQDATIFMSVIGAADMCGRLGSGIIFDIKPVQRVRRYVYGLAPVLLCLFLACFPFATLFWHFVVICVCYGLSVGMFLSQIASLLADWLGKERLPSAIGLATFFRGAGVLVGPVFGGLLYDVTGSYSTAFYYSASAAFCSSLVYASLITLHLIRQRRHRQERVEPVQDEEL